MVKDDEGSSEGKTPRNILRRQKYKIDDIMDTR